MKTGGGAMRTVLCLAALLSGCGEPGSPARADDSGGDRGGDSASETDGAGATDAGALDGSVAVDASAEADVGAFDAHPDDAADATDSHEDASLPDASSSDAAVAISPSQVSFGPFVVGSSSPLTRITVTNNGTAPLSISLASLGGAQLGDFALSDDTCTGTTISPGASCAVSVKFAPYEVCKVSKATLTISDDAPTSPQTISLSGTGVAGTTGQYGSLLYCTSLNAQPSKLAPLANGDVGFTEYGTVGDSPPAIASVNTLDGVRENAAAVRNGFGWAPSELTVAPDGTSAYFEAYYGPQNGLVLDVVSPGGSTSQFSLNDLGVTGPIGVGPDGAFWIAADHTCEGSIAPFVRKVVPGAQPVDFTPGANWLQAHLGTVCAATTVITAGPDGNVWLGLKAQFGSAVSGFARLTTAGVFVDFIRTSGGDPVAATMAPDGNLYALVGAPRASSCRLVTFDGRGVGTTVLSLAAGAWMSCSSLVSGADGRLWRSATPFDGTAFVDSLAAFDPKSGAVSFYPAPPSVYLVDGPDQGIWFNSGPSAVGRFDLGGGPARAFVQPKMIGFPSAEIGVGSSVRIVTVRSTGTGPLTISGTSLRGADPGEFVLADSCTGQALAPGSTCSLSVSSKPTRTGSTTAALIIDSDDVFGSQTVNLGKFTIPPPPQISPAQVPFPATQVGKKSSEIVLTLTNPAEESVAVSFVAVRGANSSDFAIVTDQCGGTTVPANGTCTVTVAFLPTMPGARTANVMFVYTAAPPSQVVALSGTGQAVPDSGAGGSDAGGACGCSPAGAFVNPVVVGPAGSSSSPNGLFTLAVTSGDARHPVAAITVRRSSGTTLLTFTPPIDSTWPATSAWGFSPDDKRFVVHYQAIGLDWIELFDLTTTNPNTPVWTRSLPIAPGATATSPAGSVGFSPHGDYLVATQLQTPVGSLLQTVFLYIVGATGSPVKTSSWNPYKPPQGDAPDTTVDSAFWGFSPDDQSFTRIALDANGVPTLSLLALPGGAAVQNWTFTSSVAAYVQYGPCGEVLALVDQLTDPQHVSPPNPVTISIYSTSATDALNPPLGAVSGLPAPNAGISLSAGASNYTAQSADFQNTVVLAPISAAAACRDE